MIFRTGRRLAQFDHRAARVMRLTKWERFWKLDVPGFEALVDTVYGILTGREEAAEQAVAEAAPAGSVRTPAEVPLPEVSAGGLSGLLEILAAKGGEQISERAPLIKAILRALRATTDGTLREGFFLDLLRRGFSADEARHQLDIAIDWGRYGELFEYDAESGQLILGSDAGTVGG